MKDRIVVLTGAAGGIGTAIARRLARAGARLALVDRDAAGLDALATALSGSRAEVSIHLFDLRELAELDQLAHAVVAAHGGVDVLINNAGVTVHGPLVSQSAEDVARVIGVDLHAVIETTRVFLPRLRDRPGAHVVHIASMAGLQGFPFQSTYSAAKFGLRGFGQALRPELAAMGIGCSTILPGTIATGFLRHTPTHDPVSSARLATLMERFGTSPDRVAAAVTHALRWNRSEVRVGWDAHLLALTRWLCPPLLPWLLGSMLRRGFFGATKP